MILCAFISKRSADFYERLLLSPQNQSVLQFWDSGGQNIDSKVVWRWCVWCDGCVVCWSNSTPVGQFPWSFDRWSARVRQVLKCRAGQVPWHSTVVGQPADVTWKFPFQSCLWRYWLDYFQYRIQQHPSETRSLRLELPKCLIIVRWNSESLMQLSKETTAKGYRV